MSLAGREKSRNYYLLYGGGLHVGLLLDLELRKATGGQRRIDDLMQALYRDFGLPRQNLTTNDVERVASEIAGTDLSWIFERFVRGTEAIDPSLVYAPLGLVVSEVKEDGQKRTVIAIDPNASKQARDLRFQVLRMR